MDSHSLPAVPGDDKATLFAPDSYFPSQKRTTAGSTRGFILLCFSGLFFLSNCENSCRERQARTKPGDLGQFLVLRGPGDLERLLIVNSVETTLGRGSNQTVYRLDTVDTKTGRRLKRKILEFGGHDPTVMPAAPGQFWCYYLQSNSLELRDAASLNVVKTWAQLKRIPALSPGIAQHQPMDVDRGTGSLIFTSATAETWILDPQTFDAKPHQESRDELHLDSYLGGGTVLVSTLQAPEFRAQLGKLQIAPTGNVSSLANGQELTPEQVTAMWKVPRLTTRAGESSGTESSGEVPLLGTFSFVGAENGKRSSLAFQASSNGGPLESGTTFIDPRFLHQRGVSDYRILLMPDPEGFLVVHKASLENNPRLLFSRIDLNGKARWTVEDSPGIVMAGHLSGTTVIIAVEGTGDDRSYVLCLDATTGRVLWRYRV